MKEHVLGKSIVLIIFKYSEGKILVIMLFFLICQNKNKFDSDIYQILEERKIIHFMIYHIVKTKICCQVKSKLKIFIM